MAGCHRLWDTLKNIVYFILSPSYFTDEETEAHKMWNGTSHISQMHTGDAVGRHPGQTQAASLSLQCPRTPQEPWTIAPASFILVPVNIFWPRLSHWNGMLGLVSEPGWRSSPTVLFQQLMKRRGWLCGPREEADYVDPGKPALTAPYLDTEGVSKRKTLLIVNYLPLISMALFLRKVLFFFFF